MNNLKWVAGSKCLLSVGLALGLVLSGGSALAATMEVKTTGSSGCSLLNAIASVNDHAHTFGSCPRGTGTFAAPDVIRLAKGLTFTLTSGITINNSVTILAWDFSANQASRTRATLLQGGPSGGQLVWLSSPTAANAPSTKVTFEDIVLRGTGATNSTTGIVTEGNDAGDILFLTRSRVENFGHEGIIDQNFSLTVTDTAIDSNGIAMTAEFASGLFIESTFADQNHGLTALVMDKSSVTNNYQGGVQLELRPTATSTIMNSTIAYNSGDTLVVTNGAPGHRLNLFGSTISHNTGYLSNAMDGMNYAGVWNDSGIVTIDQTVIEDNRDADLAAYDFYGDLQSTKNSIIGDDSAITNTPTQRGVNVLSTNQWTILEDTLTDNGGIAGQSHPLSLRPVVGISPSCINFTSSIDSSVGGVAVGTLDQGHRARGYPGTSGLRFDVGAVELR